MDIDGYCLMVGQGARPFYMAIAMISIAASRNLLQRE
jgi:hypothetical protein